MLIMIEYLCFRTKADTVFDIGHLFCFISSINQSLTFLARGLLFGGWKIKTNEIWTERYQKRFGRRSSVNSL